MVLGSRQFRGLHISVSPDGVETPVKGGLITKLTFLYRILPHTDLKILVYLLSLPEEAECPSVTELSKIIKKDIRTIQLSIQRLVNIGILGSNKGKIEYINNYDPNLNKPIPLVSEKDLELLKTLNRGKHETET